MNLLRLAGAVCFATLAALAQSPSVSNLSTRVQVGTGQDLLIVGFNVGPGTDQTMLIRATGPALAGFGVTGVLADPKLELFSGATKIGENDNWGTPVGPEAFAAPALSSAFSQNGAFAFTPGSRDAALIAEFQPGSYTVLVSGVGSSSGVALVEIYDLTPVGPP